MKLFYSNQTGRSMIEMLGVLAIVGILSVGGISGYSKAMTKYRYIKFSSELNSFLTCLTPYVDNLIKRSSNISYAPIESSILSKICNIPETWKAFSGLNKIANSLGHKMNFFVRGTSNPKSLVIDYIFNDQNNKGRKLSHDEIMSCQYVWQYVIIPNSGMIHRAFMTSLTNYFMGDNFCSASVKCIQNMTIQDITELCNSCVSDQTTCVIAIDILH